MRFALDILPAATTDVAEAARWYAGVNMSATTEHPATELSSMIVRAPQILGGKPCLKAHRVPIHRVAGCWKLGITVEQIGERLSTLSPAEIHSALAYYHLHRDEIQGYLEEERAACLHQEPDAPLST